LFKYLAILMGYNIEVSFSITKHPNITELKKEITDLALDYGCDHYYYIYEMEDNSRYKREHIVIVINFCDTEIFSCAKLLKKFKQIKGIHIECIYNDDIECKLLYASQYYLTTIDRSNVIKYNKNKRERSLSENDKVILEPIMHIKK
jgi:hypothetical protein